jgi:hypothetical protein
VRLCAGDDEKALLRAAVVSSLCGSALPQDVALQLCLVVSKIARCAGAARWRGTLV